MRESIWPAKLKIFFQNMFAKHGLKKKSVKQGKIIQYVNKRPGFESYSNIYSVCDF